MFDLRQAFARALPSAACNKPKRQWLSKQDVLDEYPLTERMLKRMRDQRRINTYTITKNGEYVFKRSELDAYFEAGLVPAADA